MNLKELEAKLTLLRVHPDCYSLDGSYKDEAVMLSCEGASWVVYYSERGQRNSFARFNSLDDACQEVLARVAADPLKRAAVDDSFWVELASWKKPWWKFW
jgi:hypothetical protein